MLPARRGGSSREALQHDRVPRPHRAVRQELMAGERIVFVDDEEQIRKLLSTWLSRHGYEVTLANDGWEAFRAIHGETTTKRGGNVILFVHGKGGVGCTTLAVNSAVALAATTIYRVTLLDLNLEFGNVPMLMNLAPDRTLADLAEEAHTELDDATFERYLTQDRSGVKVLAGCDTPERAELVTVPAVQQAIDHLQMQSDYVVIDAPASFSQQVLAALDVADAVII